MVFRKSIRISFISLAATVILAFGLTGYESKPDNSAVETAARDTPRDTVPVQASDLSLKTAIARVARQNIPAVVHIDVTQRQEIMNPMLPINELYWKLLITARDRRGMSR